MSTPKRRRIPRDDVPATPPADGPGPAGTGQRPGAALLEAIQQLREAIRQMPGGLAGAFARNRTTAGSDEPEGIHPEAAATDPTPRSPTRADGLRATVDRVAAGLGAHLAQGAERFRTRMDRATAGVAVGFERSFDASLGRVIAGLGKGFAGGARFARQAATNPGSVLGAVSSAWTPAMLGAALVGAYGAKRARKGAAQGWAAVTRVARQIGRFRPPRAVTRRVARHFGRRYRRGSIAAQRAWQATGNPLAVLKAFSAGAIPALGPILAGVNAALAAVQAMRGRAEEINAGNRPLGRYHGGIGTAFMQLDQNEFYRSVRMAREVAGSTVSLIRSVDRMRENWQGVDVLGREVNNRVGGFFAGFSSEIGKRASAAVAPVIEHVKAADPNGLVSGGGGAGFAAGIWGFGASIKDQLMTDPMAWLWAAGVGWKALQDGRKAAADAAAAHVNALGMPVWDENQWGRDLHRMAAPGPFLKRPAPKK